MNCSKRGFSLIEIMVALMLLGIIAVLVASGTRLTLGISGRGTARAEALRAEQIERHVVRSQLQGALPYRYFTQEEDRRIEHLAFEGERDRIRFVSREGILDGPESLPRWVELRTQQSANTPARLVIEEHRILSPDNQPGENVSARAEITNCTGIHFEFLDNTGEKPQWLPAWPASETSATLPFAVRMECIAAGTAMKTLIPLDYAESARLGMRLQ